MSDTPKEDWPVYNVDFNARTADDRVRIDTIGVTAAVRESRITPGSWAWLTDGEVRVGGQIQQTETGLVARVAWETVERQPNDGLRPRALKLAGLPEARAERKK